MKKSLILMATLILVIVIVVAVKINDIQKQKQEILNYNKEFEYYCNKEILGTDITTLINKAIDINEKNNIQKDEKGLYLQNSENSVKIYIKMKFTENVYPMESFYTAGINDFTKYFGGINFKSSKIDYHENGRISSITFEEQ